MPEEANKRPANRWEGTHTYARSDPSGKRLRTAAQVREEALRRIKEDREKRSTESDRRRSLPAPRPTKETRKGSPTRSKIPVIQPDSAESDPSGEMPNSNKKKRQASGKPDDNANTDGIDPALKAFLLAIKEDINKSTDAAVDRIDRRIDEHAKSIGELKQAVVDVDKKIEEKVVSCVRQEVAKIAKEAKTAPPLGPATRSDRQQAAYNYCRRSLKIWPIVGDGDLLDAVKNFLSTKLKFSDDRIGLLGHIEASRAQGRAARERNEAIVTFETRVERDCVKGAGINLAGQSEVGMSIHVPGHLMDNLVALNGVGYGIKQKQHGVKRAIKFDDINQDIYMDICIDGQWKKITPTKARQVAKQMPAIRGASASLSLEDLSGLVGNSGTEGTRNEDKEDGQAPTVVVLDEEEA